MHPKYLIFILLAGWKCSKPPEEDVYTSLQRFMAQDKHKTFVIKTQWADFDTVSFAELEQYADKIASLPRDTFDYMRKVDGFPLGWLLQRQHIGENLGYEVYVRSRKLKIHYFDMDNMLDEIRIQHKDTTNKMSYYEIVHFSYTNNEPRGFFMESIKPNANHNSNQRFHELSKSYNFIYNKDSTNTDWQKNLDLATQMRDFAMNLLAYHKSKNCPPSDFLAEGPLFRGKNLKALNKNLDSLYQTSDTAIQRNHPRPKGAFIINASVRNHPEKGYLYLSDSLRVHSLDGQSLKEKSGSRELLKSHIKQLIEAKLRSNPTPTRYCLPIRYEKFMYFYWKNSRVVEVAE